MAIQINSMKSTLATAYKNAAVYGLLFNTTTPPTTGAATGELSGGSYARISISWGTVTNGVVSTSSNLVFNVASGATVGSFGVATSGTATTADVQDWYALTSQSFASAGTYTISATVTIS